MTNVPDEPDSLGDDVMQLDESTEIIPPSQRPTSQNSRRSLMTVMRSAVAANEASSRRRSRGAPIGPENTLNYSATSQPVAASDELFSSFVMQLAAGGAGAGAGGFEAITNNISLNAQTNRGHRQTSPLRNKIVYQLRCSYCWQKVCNRAMKAILLADTKIELYSTDIPPVQLHMLEEDRMTQGCNCRIRDTVCSCCGNVLGYHVSQPCDRCLEAKNNGHFWMFYSETIKSYERPDPTLVGKPLYWGALSPMREFEDIFDNRRYEMFCR